jgi:hypothetical protein
VIDNDHQERI